MNNLIQRIRTFLNEASLPPVIARAASEFRGKMTHSAQAPIIAPGGKQADHPTWVFPSKDDAEEFQTFILDETKFKADLFQKQGKWFVSVIV